MIKIDLQSRTPIYEQLQEQILRLSLLGVLDQNEQRQGIIYTVPGRGSFVSPDVLRLEGPKREALQEVFAACDRAVERGVNPPELLAEIERHLSNPSQGGNGHD